MILSSTAPIQHNSNHANPQRSESQSELNIDTLVFNCRRVRNFEEIRQILPSLINIFPSFSEKQVRHFQEDVIPQLLRFAEIDEQQALSLMLANWYVANPFAVNRLPSALQAMHYFAKAIQIGNFRNDSVKKHHQEASSLFLALIDEQHQQTVEKILNTLTNVTSEDLHAFEIFEHHIDQFHRLPHFCTQLEDFDVINTLFTIGTRSLNKVPLERLEKYFHYR